MADLINDGAGNEATSCSRCGAALEPGAGYALGRETLCDACCLEARATRPRKTHWQYLGAIRSQYLQPADED